MNDNTPQYCLRGGGFLKPGEPQPPPFPPVPDRPIPQSFPPYDIQSLLAAYRSITDTIENIDAIRKTHIETKEQLKRDILTRMEAEGMVADGDQVKGGGVTATIQKKWRAKYEPDKWPAIVAWAAENKYTDLIQRRLTDSRVMDLVDSGVALPDGLNVEPFTDLACRRTG